MAKTSDISMTMDIDEEVIRSPQVEELTLRLIEILDSKKVDKEAVIRNLEEFNFEKSILTLLKKKKVKVDKSTLMMIIDLVNNNQSYVLSRSPILSLLPRHLLSERKNLLIYLYRLRIELMAGEKIDKNSFLKAMGQFNISQCTGFCCCPSCMIIRMVQAIGENKKLKYICKETILNFLDIVNDSIGIKTRFLINAI
jgi:hypothetical protein